MAPPDAKDAWLHKVFGIGPGAEDKASAGPETPGRETAEALEATLSTCLVKIAEYAEDDAQRDGWAKQVEQAYDLLDEGDGSTAQGPIEALQKDIAGAAARVRADNAWFSAWQAAYDGCVKSAAALKAAMVREIDAIDPAVLPEFETGWTTFDEELAGVGDVIELALLQSKKAPAESRQIIGKAAKSALAMIDQSTLLADIDGNDVQPVTIVKTLRQELARLA